MDSCSCCEEGRIIEVAAGAHDRCNVVVAAECSDECECSGSHLLLEVDCEGNETGVKLVGQCSCGCECGCGDVCSCGEMEFIVPCLKAGESKRFKLAAAAAGCGCGCSEGGVSVVDNGDTVDFLVNGELFTTWHGGPDVVRPYCYPVLGPGGVQMTREVSNDRSKMDHIHHKGIYTAMGDVNGVDNWSEEEGHGFTRNCAKWASSGPVYGQLWTINDWTDKSGKPIMSESVRIRVYNTPDNGRIMDWLIVWAADYGGVYFHDTKEAGTLAIRMNPLLNADGTGSGTITNGMGGVNDAECWGKRAQWVDYSGKIGEQTCGVAVLDHPTNYDFPTTWHVRGYGLFTVNQWGKHDFSGNWADRGDLALEEGDALAFSFRLFFHDGCVGSAKVANKWLDFAFPPQVK
jgi:hypothetical protein